MYPPRFNFLSRFQKVRYSGGEVEEEEEEEKRLSSYEEISIFHDILAGYSPDLIRNSVGRGEKREREREAKTGTSKTHRGVNRAQFSRFFVALRLFVRLRKAWSSDKSISGP